MGKSQNGLINDFTDAIKKAFIQQPFTTSDLKKFVSDNKWNYSKNYVNVALANHTSEDHTPTNRKVFLSVGDGQYKLR